MIVNLLLPFLTISLLLLVLIGLTKPSPKTLRTLRCPQRDPIRRSLLFPVTFIRTLNRCGAYRPVMVVFLLVIRLYLFSLYLIMIRWAPGLLFLTLTVSIILKRGGQFGRSLLREVRSYGVEIAFF